LSGIIPVVRHGLRRDHEVMHRTKLYQRTAAQGTETLKIVAYLDDTGGDDEIRVTHTLESHVLNDGIGFHGRGGEQWLRDRHTGWIGNGFKLISSGPDY
jgi:hypothetical protein